MLVSVYGFAGHFLLGGIVAGALGAIALLIALRVFIESKRMVGV